MLPVIQTLIQTNSTEGLLGNMIFDTVLESTDETFSKFPIYQDFNVSATTFHVQCGLLHDIFQNGTEENGVWNISTNVPGFTNTAVEWLG